MTAPGLSLATQPSALSALQTLPVLQRIGPIDGWLFENEADLLLATARRACGLGASRMLEIGSYCGRATVVLATVVQAAALDAATPMRLTTVDPHLWEDGDAERAEPSTLRRLRSNLGELSAHVDIVRGAAHRLPWDAPLALLLIDGGHSYAEVAADFAHFAPHLVNDGLLALHDYAVQFPGVQRFVDELISSGTYQELARAGSLVVLSKRPALGSVLPLLQRMHQIDGWFTFAEGDLLLATAIATTQLAGALPIVEVGSYCGRSTVLLGHALRAHGGPGAQVFAIDPHEGQVGAVGLGVRHDAPTLERFRTAIASWGLGSWVRLLQQYSFDVQWSGPIGMLFVDGLHDALNVQRDFEHFQRWLPSGAYVAFHDYSPLFPGVIEVVERIEATMPFKRIALADSLVVLQRQ